MRIENFFAGAAYVRSARRGWVTEPQILWGTANKPANFRLRAFEFLPPDLDSNRGDLRINSLDGQKYLLISTTYVFFDGL
jgi:hypothetical protein